MKKVFITVCALAAILLTVLAPVVAEAKPIDFTGLSTALMGVDFVDSHHGWAVGGSGVIYATANGGKHWKLQDWDYTGNEFTALRGVKFIDKENGWAAGHAEGSQGFEAVIIHTSNGGRQWSVQATYPQFADIYGIDFLDKNNGWACGVWMNNGHGSEIVFHTTDGGTTWSYQALSTHSETIFAVDFADLSNGWGVGGEGNIWHTADGGSNWQLQSNPLFTNYSGGPAINGVSSPNSQNAWAVGGERVLHTSNGGSLWSTQYSGSDQLNSIHFVDLQNGWAVGASGIILHTTNGGTSWQGQTRPSEDLRYVRFISPTEGWVVGGIPVADPGDPDASHEKATIIHTGNGGADWDLQFFNGN